MIKRETFLNRNDWIESDPKNVAEVKSVWEKLDAYEH